MVSKADDFLLRYARCDRSTNKHIYPGRSGGRAPEIAYFDMIGGVTDGGPFIAPATPKRDTLSVRHLLARRARLSRLFGAFSESGFGRLPVL